MKIIRVTITPVCVLLCFIFLSCGTVASVKPMGAGHRLLAFSAGGPVAPVYDINMPLPYAVLRYRFGLNDATDFHAGLHPTMALFQDLGVDVGLTKHFVRNSGARPGFSAGLSLYGFYHFADASSARLYPDLTLIATYDVSKRFRVFYFGFESMFQFTKPFVVPVFLAGGEFGLGDRLVLDLEARWYAPTESGDDRVVDYTITPFGQGAVGFVIGLSYAFQGRQQ
ncbi:hypothetical protein IBX73_03895 [candidate division WOR-3 bacterium]|nr:hypothetical protein [candidate division WOR-3 bacterium]